MTDLQKTLDFFLAKAGYIKTKNSVIAEKLQVDEDVVSQAKKQLLDSKKLSSDFKPVEVWVKSKEQSIKYKLDRQETNKADKESFLKELLKQSPLEHVKFADNNDGVVVEISLPDFHLGKYTGETLEEQVQLYLNTISNLIHETKHLKIDKFILPIGNDLINSEGNTKKTTNNTPQFDNASWREVFKKAWTMLTSAIKMLSDIAPVHVIVIPGNHSFATEYYIGEVLEAFYTNNFNVTVDNSNSPRKYFYFGNVLLGYTHGDCEKHSELPLIMATEVPELFGKTIYREFHLGHIHKEKVDEYRGVTVRFLPSLSATDEWHEKMGYHSIRKCQAYIWDKDKGLKGYIQISI